MRRLGITQRVEVIHDYGERRDCLDQRWSELAFRLDFIPVPLPNITPDLASVIALDLQLDAVLLSGGNTISALDPDAPNTAPERDRFEYALIDAATDMSLPIVGICRGMQVINKHLGGNLTRLDGHVSCRHALQVDPAFSDMIVNDVNSYHNWGIAPGQLTETLCPIAVDNEGYTEAFTHKNEKISGIMWHPEREQPIRPIDIKLLKFLLT
jgi:putative glutamine amidotransferase